MIAATENTERDIHDPYAYELDEIDVSLNERFVQNTFWGFFERTEKRIRYIIVPKANSAPIGLSLALMTL